MTCSQGMVWGEPERGRAQNGMEVVIVGMRMTVSVQSP